jgi:hypothetical protein
VLLLWKDGHSSRIGSPEFFREGHRRQAAPAIDQPPRRAALVQLTNHRLDRSDSDAAGNQHIVRRGNQWEMISRAGAVDFISDIQPVVNLHRPAATILLT